MHGNGKECGAGFCKVQGYIDDINEDTAKLDSAQEKRGLLAPNELDERTKLNFDIVRFEINLENAKQYVQNNTCEKCPHRKDPMIEAMIDIIMERDQQT